ncbi:metallopeptidase family protein [Falsirhodobacter deserti]|uniref:metallopeptidase family protein n=1 Tax=Falsirhodobacter deserti TaxID=1365611 RepID=UPI000FE2B13F|nr:metallopeptidase family protein [Falsirhodobacter deserti]
MDQTAPDLAIIESLALEVVEALPARWQAARSVIVVVEDWPSDDLLDEMEIENPYELTGLYEGVPLTQKSVMDQPVGPDIIRLFRRPILDEWADRGNVSLRELVGHVMVHELAHHFGWSDDDIAAIDPWWE